MTGTNFNTLLVVFFYLTVDCLTVPLWYKQQVTFLNPNSTKFVQKSHFSALYPTKNLPKSFGIVQLMV